MGSEGLVVAGTGLAVGLTDVCPVCLISITVVEYITMGHFRTDVQYLLPAT